MVGFCVYQRVPSRFSGEALIIRLPSSAAWRHADRLLRVGRGAIGLREASERATPRSCPLSVGDRPASGARYTQVMSLSVCGGGKCFGGQRGRAGIRPRCGRSGLASAPPFAILGLRHQPGSEGMGSPTWELDNDATTVTITFATEPPTRLKLDLAAVGDFLKALWSVRTAMMPEIVRELPPAPRWVALRNPIWFADPGGWDGDSLLHLRDPGYGWLRYYLIPRDEAGKACPDFAGTS